MTEADFSPEYSQNPAVLYSRGAPRSPEEQRFQYHYSETAVAAWAQERKERYFDHIKPLLMYSDDDGHAVAWVSHTGWSEAKDDEPMKEYKVCHVVCDCVADSEESTGHPREVRVCEAVDAVLQQRAEELSKAYGNDIILATLTEFDDDTMTYGLSQDGQILAAKAIAYVLETDKIQPATWMANPVAGLHKVTTLAAILSQGTQTVMPVLEAMEQGELVTINGDEVRLSPDIPFF